MEEKQESGEDSVDGKEIDDRTIKEVAANLRIIGDEINAKYTKLSLRNIFLWIRIIRIFGRIWIWKKNTVIFKSEVNSILELFICLS